MATPPDWTDEALLDYVELHSQTERALFHVDHVNRLLELAGHPGRFAGNGFTDLHYQDAKPLIEEARRRLAEQARSIVTEGKAP
jgi:hypothetical protein